MSSPNNDGGPPPDPPHPPGTDPQSDAAPEAVSSDAARLSTPPPVAPPAPTVEDELAASSSPRAEEPAQASANANASPNAPQSPSQQTGRRPLHSYSVFFPFTRQPGEGTGNGDRIGLTWTLEVFANEGDGDNDAPPPTEPNDRQQAPDGNNERPQTAAEAVLAAAEAEAAGRGAGATEGQNTPGEPRPAPNADGPGTERRNFIFVVGPDGLVPRPGQEDAGPAPFPFLFPFNLPFMMQPSGPDPAKAAELLASLPTVKRALLRRVDKVVAAEDASNGKEYEDRGWRCGICLEGIEEPAESPQPVKALPCNHLFHGPCLEPWFSSHHTCPTCRLDLDPLRTLNDPRDTRRNPLRPAPTGSGRGTPGGAPGRDHPYARGRDRDRTGLRSGQQTPVEQPEERDAQDTQEPRVVDEPTLPGLLELTRAAAQSIARGLFGGPTTGSPMPMDGERERTPAGPERPPGMRPAGAAADGDMPANNADNNAPTGNASGSEHRPTPERRPHISVIHLGHPPFGRSPFDQPPNPFQHIFGRPTGSDSTEPRPASGEASQDSSAAEPTTAEQVSASADDRPSTPQTSSERDAATDEAPQQSATSNEGRSNADEARPDGGDGPRRPRPRYPWELPPFLFLPTGTPPAPATPPPERPASTFVPQSLESWTEQREKTLGWRCDAVECLVAPPVPDGGSEDMDVDEPPAEAEDEDMISETDKEMLSIYSAQQPLTPNAKDGQGAQPSAEFVLLTCPHRWHRTCLEVAERSAGHSGQPDTEGRQWVRCMTCRKEGWVLPRTPSPAAAAGAVEPIPL